jgi:hypothetical protein
MTEEKLEQEETSDDELYKDIKDADDWKAKHFENLKKAEKKRDRWKNKWEEGEKTNVSLKEENEKLTEIIEEMENKNLGGKKYISRAELSSREENNKQQRFNKFLNRIK